ncbi:MAG: hypothetical protein C5B54_04260 [Acidobacteria bacterium]|nr:MAG: hypothetical protein C5B54_04260 [Acidobacteriota bacterium]
MTDQDYFEQEKLAHAHSVMVSVAIMRDVAMHLAQIHKLHLILWDGLSDLATGLAEQADRSETVPMGEVIQRLVQLLQTHQAAYEAGPKSDADSFTSRYTTRA